MARAKPEGKQGDRKRVRKKTRQVWRIFPAALSTWPAQSVMSGAETLNAAKKQTKDRIDKTDTSNTIGH
ncbi:MAG TPA: hypothetical protein VD840_02575 [Sinorhizobium sp.]|nr:hypothetical protein [Sinorhizobium sp.]